MPSPLCIHGVSILLNLLEPTLSLLLCPCLFSLILRIFLFTLFFARNIVPLATCTISYKMLAVQDHLKWQRQGFLTSGFFSWIIFPQAPDYSRSRISSKIQENIGSKYWCCAGINDTRRQVNRQYRWHRLANTPLVSTTPVVTFFSRDLHWSRRHLGQNLPPMSNLRVMN